MRATLSASGATQYERYPAARYSLSRYGLSRCRLARYPIDRYSLARYSMDRARIFHASPRPTGASVDPHPPRPSVTRRHCC